MKILKFFEANLNLNELSKPSKSGGLRGDVLVKKLQQGEEIKVNIDDKSFNTKIANPEEIIPNITDEQGNYDENKAKSFLLKGDYYKKIFHSETGEFYQLNNFEKTEEFGSSGGTSTGTKDTIIVESIQCLFLALRQQKRRSLTEESIYELFDHEDNIIELFLSNIRVPIQLNYDLIFDYSEVWINTFISTANALYETRPAYTGDFSIYEQVLDINTNYVFYHHLYKEGFTKLLTNAYRNLPETKDIPISKWTPSDIWAVSKAIDSNKNLFEDCNNISTLNSKINSLFYDGRTKKKWLRGISLKKLRTIQKETDIELVINKLTPKPRYEFETVITSLAPLSSLGVNIVVRQFSKIEKQNNILQIMNLRSFFGQNQLSDVSGEVMGVSARHGKIGLERINHIIKTYKDKFRLPIEPIETKIELEKYTDEELYDIVKEMNQKIIQLSGENTAGRREKFSFRARLISKYQSLKFGLLLYQLNKEFIKQNDIEIKLSNKILQEIFFYAMCIENDVFTCPMYVRII